MDYSAAILVAAFTYAIKQIIDFVLQQENEVKERDHLNKMLLAIFESSCEDYQAAFELTNWKKLTESLSDPQYCPYVLPHCLRALWMSLEQRYVIFRVLLSEQQCAFMPRSCILQIS